MYFNILHMTPIHYFQLLIISVCVQLFTLFTYVTHYEDLLAKIYQKNIHQEYDYIIVGSGTAGSVIAHRLATETNYTFIILEAGSRGNLVLEIPILGPLLHRSVYDWQFETVPQEHACHAMEDNKCRLPQGKIIGGSSKLNNMIHVRGNISHYVDWFAGKHCEKYIKKQFDIVEKKMFHLNHLRYQTDLANTVIIAAKELGYNKLGSDFEQGFMKSKLSQRHGKRWTTSDNLNVSKHILSNALVEKVLFTGNIATGVTYTLLKKKQNVYARKGVIISAGTYNSPKILQLSGIGPEKLLESLKIPVIKNLPVGRNLQDHVTTGFDLVLFDDLISIKPNAILSLKNIANYFFNGIGPLTTPGCEVVGFLSTKNESTPDLQFMVLPVGITSDRGSFLRTALGITDKVWYNYFSKVFGNNAATFLPIILHPKSKGSVFINSTNYEIPPLIDPRYLSNPEDKEVLKNGIKLVMEFVSTKAMKAVGAHMNPNHFPGCENFKLFSDSYLECYIKQLSFTSYHPIGTCSMGLPHSENTVVDTSFKVLGIEKLYVADASVLPTLPSGNINAAIAMMASVFFETSISRNIPISYKREHFYGNPDIKKCYINESDIFGEDL